jgi:glycosyltransferase involved in cell wall biosynthesis
MLVNITIPVLNEEKILRNTIARIQTAARNSLRYPHELVIADNGSTDDTLQIALSLAAADPSIQVIRLDEKGRGRALKTAWLCSEADILTYMDADLSTDLNSFSTLINALICDKYDLSTGSRLLKPELTTRCLKREFTSRTYNLLLHAALHVGFSDAQCGFKAITRTAARCLLPKVENTNWFFDTELLALAERFGYRIFELPVRWVESRDSHVNVFRTAAEDIRGVIRLAASLHKLAPQTTRMIQPHSAAPTDSAVSTRH